MSVRRAPFDAMLVVDPRIDGVLEGLARIAEHARGERIAVQLRAKDASDAELVALAREIAAVQPAMSRLLVNGRAAVARAIAADGVHLPESGGAVGEARSQLLPEAIVGCSCHDAEGIALRARQGADYVLLGPLGDVPGKPALRDATFASIVQGSLLPVIALGGIATEADADRALSLGASGIAIERAVLAPETARWLPRWLARRSAA